jgi:hypothetical protein
MATNMEEAACVAAMNTARAAFEGAIEDKINSIFAHLEDPSTHPLHTSLGVPLVPLADTLAAAAAPDGPNGPSLDKMRAAATQVAPSATNPRSNSHWHGVKLAHASDGFEMCLSGHLLPLHRAYLPASASFGIGSAVSEETAGRMVSGHTVNLYDVHAGAVRPSDHPYGLLNGLVLAAATRQLLLHNLRSVVHFEALQTIILPFELPGGCVAERLELFEAALAHGYPEGTGIPRGKTGALARKSHVRAEHPRRHEHTPAYTISQWRTMTVMQKEAAWERALTWA